MRGLRGKRVLISGGSSGIGLATAERFLEEGSRVFVCGIDPAELEAAVAAYAFLASDDAAFVPGTQKNV